MWLPSLVLPGPQQARGAPVRLQWLSAFPPFWRLSLRVDVAGQTPVAQGSQPISRPRRVEEPRARGSRPWNSPQMPGRATGSLGVRLQAAHLGCLPRALLAARAPAPARVPGPVPGPGADPLPAALPAREAARAFFQSFPFEHAPFGGSCCQEAHFPCGVKLVTTIPTLRSYNRACLSWPCRNSMLPKQPQNAKGCGFTTLSFSVQFSLRMLSQTRRSSEAIGRCVGGSQAPGLTLARPQTPTGVCIEIPRRGRAVRKRGDVARKPAPLPLPCLPLERVGGGGRSKKRVRFAETRADPRVEDVPEPPVGARPRRGGPAHKPRKAQPQARERSRGTKRADAHTKEGPAQVEVQPLEFEVVPDAVSAPPVWL